MYSTSAGVEMESVGVLFIDEFVGRGVISEVDGSMEAIEVLGFVGRGVISVEVGSVEEVSRLDVVVECFLVDELVLDDVRGFGSIAVELGRTVEGNTLVSPFVFVDISSSKVSVELGV